jgi:hypothetical protein
LCTVVSVTANNFFSASCSDKQWQLHRQLQRQRAHCPMSPVRPEQQERAELRGQAPHTAAEMNTDGQQPWSPGAAA